MATTTNYGWVTPDDTALVKDGAAAIRTLGTSVDTTVHDNEALAIAKTFMAAKGDLISATANDTPSILTVGANGTTLVADSSEATGLKWAAASAGGANWSLLNAGGTALTAAGTITVSGISNKDKIMVLVRGASTNSTTGPSLTYRFNADTGSNYYAFGLVAAFGSVAFLGQLNHSGTSIPIGNAAAHFSSNHIFSGGLIMTGANAAGKKSLTFINGGENGSGGGTNDNVFFSGIGYYDSASTISSVSIITSAGNFDAGTIFIYTSA